MTTAGHQERRRILELVKDGAISPSEAAELLDALSREPADEETSELTTTHTGVTAVRVVGTFRALKIEGDSSVAGAIARGPHKARNDDGTLVFEEEYDPESPGFVLFGPASSGSRRKARINVDVGGRSFRWDRELAPPVLKIRMNPNLPLEVDMTAGSVRVRDIVGPITATLAAGSGHFDGVRGPIRLSADAGSVKVSGIFDEGESEIRCTAGKVHVSLRRGSSVRITARATLGKILLPSGEQWAGLGGGMKEVTVGGGKAKLDVEATTGLVTVVEEK
ncbi:MAG: hypothetical protein KY429_02060 [Actinobacteria bacterium]|nr:hypothetical protein [Actinomycetota bacterium]